MKWLSYSLSSILKKQSIKNIKKNSNIPKPKVPITPFEWMEGILKKKKLSHSGEMRFLETVQKLHKEKNLKQEETLELLELLDKRADSKKVSESINEYKLTIEDSLFSKGIKSIKDIF